MEWQFRGDKPIYSQLVEKIQLAIVSGELPPGSKLPPVRELAADAGVNPNTMQRAMQELEREGMVFALRTAGRYVTTERSVIESVKRSLAKEHIAAFLKAMGALGYDRPGIIGLLKEEKEGIADADSGM